MTSSNVPSGPMVDKNGRPTPEWWSYFVSLIGNSAFAANMPILLGAPGPGTGPGQLRGIQSNDLLPVAGHIPGGERGDNAASGQVGEYVSLIVAAANAIALTDSTVADLGSIMLSAGDWNVWGALSIQGSNATTVDVQGWLSLSSATNPGAPNNGAFTRVVSSAGAQSLPIAAMRLSTAASQTALFESFVVTGGGGGQSAYGFLGARRMR